MSTTFSLDDIRADAEAKYGSLDIQVGDRLVRLLNPLRLSKTKRAEVLEFQNKLKEDGVDQVEVLSNLIRVVADSPSNATALLKGVGDDLALLAEIFSQYGKQTKLGEASGSQN